MAARDIIKKLVETDVPINIDRHGSFPSRPEGARFDKPEDYNDHMGFDAALTGDESYPEAQQRQVRLLMAQGYQVSGHSKIPGGGVEVLMTLRTRTGSRYADVQPDGRIS